MADLNLTELDRLEREAEKLRKAFRAGETDDLSALWHADLAASSAIYSQLRPLLELVERLGVSLEDAATALHADRAHEGRFWNCGRFGCLIANTLIAEWKRAKGD